MHFAAIIAQKVFDQYALSFYTGNLNKLNILLHSVIERGHRRSVYNSQPVIGGIRSVYRFFNQSKGS
jgi:hypothetical protein